MMNVLVTMLRKDDGSLASSIIAKFLEEDFRGVSSIEWRPQHVVFHFEDGNFAAVLASRILEIVTYED
jgi:hypothetical protein